MISQRAKRVGLKELEIFENFQIDRNLPKHKKPIEVNEEQLNSITINATNSAFVTIGGDSIQNTTILTPQDSSVDYKRNPNYLKQFINFLISIIKHKKKFTILQFFVGLSKSVEDLTTTIKTASVYEEAIKQASDGGQIALIEKLQDLIFVCKNEANLVDLKYNKYVTERQIVDFYEKISDDKKKNLRLTYIKNFTRIIPSEIITIKKHLDENKIFDNYVILHYDPEQTVEEMTKAEKEYKKDPILFGVMEKSRKLYYIADWKDQICDLTLDQMFSTLGEKVFEINNNTIRTFINTGGVDINTKKKNIRRNIKTQK